MQTVRIPYRYVPRDYQRAVWRARAAGAKRILLEWHRRSGKEKTLWNLMIREACLRVGTYYYVFPTYSQGRKVIWQGKDRDGFPFLDHVPSAIRKGNPNQVDMRIELRTGSTIQVVGAENINSLMSTNPVGLVYAEFSLTDPSAWEYATPILVENGGWAAFDFTPRGQNHATDLHDIATDRMREGDPRWFAQTLTIRDTGVISEADLEEERRTGLSEEFLAQEYHCSRLGINEGSVYGKEMADAEAGGRICSVPWEPAIGVHTWWDLGHSHAMAVWFTQDVGREIHVIEYMEVVGSSLPAMAKELAARPYVYAGHHAPHDIMVVEIGSGRSRMEQAQSLGIRFERVPNLPKEDGRQAVKSLIPVCWFDRAKTQRGRDALKGHSREYDSKRKCFKPDPIPDWTHDGCDAFRYLAVGHKFSETERKQSQFQRRASQSGANAWMAV